MRKEKRGLWFLGVLFSGFLLCGGGLETGANAQGKFPTRPIEVIVPLAAGSGTDNMTRILSDAATPFLEQKLVVINKSGGSGTIGMSAVAQAKADGYTLGCTWCAPLTMVPHVLKVSYTLDDFTYITLAARGPFIFCVRPEFPAKNAQEFFEYVKEHPGKFTYTTEGVGNTLHFAGERIFQAMKVKLRPIPFSGAGDQAKALLGGHADIYAGSLPAILPHIKAGKVRPLFVTTKERNKELPEVPSVTDLGHPEAETANWRGVIGPKGIPADRLAVLEKALRQAAQSEKMKTILDQLGETAVGSSGKEFEEQVRTDAASLAIVAKVLGLTPK